MATVENVLVNIALASRNTKHIGGGAFMSRSLGHLATGLPRAVVSRQRPVLVVTCDRYNVEIFLVGEISL
jgi:hypothetical protein